jgi:hypothetical protein
LVFLFQITEVQSGWSNLNNKWRGKPEEDHLSFHASSGKGNFWWTIIITKLRIVVTKEDCHNPIGILWLEGHEPSC